MYRVYEVCAPLQYVHHHPPGGWVPFPLKPVERRPCSDEWGDVIAAWHECGGRVPSRFHEAQSGGRRSRTGFVDEKGVKLRRRSSLGRQQNTACRWDVARLGRRTRFMIFQRR